MRRPFTRQISAAVVLVSVAAPFVVAAAPGMNLLAQAGPAGSAAPSGSAAGGDEAAKKEEAKEHFIRGVGLMQEEQWDAALVEFNASIALFPTRNARKNAATCLKVLGRFSEALDAYEELQKEYGAQLPPADQEFVKKEIAYLIGVTGFLAITANVEGATIVVDSKPRGTTPLTAPVRVGQGTHTIRVVKEGYVPFETTTPILGKQTVKIEAKLEVLARSGGLVVIEETGAEAEVIIDGAPKGKVGKAPYQEKIGPGAHWVALKGPGNLGTQPAPVNVQVDQTFTLRLKLEELPAEVRVEAEPVGAAIVLDGVPVGQGSWEGRLRAGAHKVDATSDGYFRTTKNFDAVEGPKQTIKVKLDRDENSPFWTAGRTRKISIGFFGSGVWGLFGFGSDYEKSCSNGGTTTCGDRSKPYGIIGGARGGYEIAPGLSLELNIGYAYVKAALDRKTRLIGEQSTPVNVDIRDEWSMRGFLVGVGAAYRFLAKPVAVYGAISGGVLVGASVRDRRSGHISCLNAAGEPSGATNCSGAETRLEPSPRSMLPTNSTPISTTIPWVAPEVRVGYPISDSIQVGAALGVFIGIADARPKIVQTPQATPTDNQPSVPLQPGETTPRAIGFVPQPNATPETAVGTFILPEASLFVRVAF